MHKLTYKLVVCGRCGVQLHTASIREDETDDDSYGHPQESRCWPEDAAPPLFPVRRVEIVTPFDFFLDTTRVLITQPAKGGERMENPNTTPDTPEEETAPTEEGGTGTDEPQESDSTEESSGETA